MGQRFPLASSCHITTIWQVCRALLLALICTNLSLLLNLKNLFNFSFFLYSLKLTPEGNLNIPLHNEIALSFSLELRCHYQPSVPSPAIYFFHQRNNSRHEIPHWSNNHLKLLECCSFRVGLACRRNSNWSNFPGNLVALYAAGEENSYWLFLPIPCLYKQHHFVASCASESAISGTQDKRHLKSP